IIASPIGTIIIAVAVLEIHIDKNPVETINPKIIIFVFVPTTEIIVKAIRRCKFHFSIAKAIINPPINKKIVPLPYADVVSLNSKLFVSGNNTIGKREVAGIGTASVIHQTAIQLVLAKTARASGFKPSGVNKNKINTNDKGPRIKPSN